MKTLILALFIVSVALSSVYAADFTLIVNQANPESSISKSDAKSIFLGKKSTWSDGTAVQPVQQKKSAIHKGFTKAITGKSSKQFANFWKKATFTGTGVSPKSLPNDAEVMAFIAANAGAIGYVSAGTAIVSVKALEIK